MDNYSFRTDHNSFKCVECDERMSVEVVQMRPRPVTCEKCGTVFMVSRGPDGGLTVQVITESEPDPISEDEKNLEENDEE